MFRVPKSYSLVYKGRFGKEGVVHVMYHIESGVFVVRMSDKKNVKIVTFNYEDKAGLVAYMNNLLGW